MRRLTLILLGVVAILVFGVSLQESGIWSLIAWIALVIPGAILLTWDSWRRNRR